MFVTFDEDWFGVVIRVAAEDSRSWLRRLGNSYEAVQVENDRAGARWNNNYANKY